MLKSYFLRSKVFVEFCLIYEVCDRVLYVIYQILLYTYNYKNADFNLTLLTVIMLPENVNENKMIIIIPAHIYKWAMTILQIWNETMLLVYD